jgi:hypothetical protein
MIKSIRIVLLKVLIFSLAFSKNDPYLNFKKYMDQNMGSIFNINFYQSQYNERLVFEGVICFKSYKKYIFDNKITRIIYNNKYIKTINKQNKQIIYDEIIEGELSLFDLLFSNKRLDVSLGASLNPDISIINFKLKSLDIRGVLKTDNLSGEPKQLSLFNVDSSLVSVVEINRIESKVDFNLKAIDTTSYELIDLRE